MKIEEIQSHVKEILDQQFPFTDKEICGRMLHLIDLTTLDGTDTHDKVENLCHKAIQYQTAAVCVYPYYASVVKNALEGTSIRTACVAGGFPASQLPLNVKLYEVEQTLKDGADEIDMVINVGFLKSGMTDEVLEDIKAVRKACEGHTLKVIIETCLLSDEEKRIACELSEKAGADYVKTITGVSTGGATAEDVRLMRSVVGDRLGVKASGGIRDYKTALAMIEAGASRIGASAGVRIVKEQDENR